MAQKRSKRYRQAAELIEEGKSYSLAEAVDTLKKFPAAKYDETVTVSMKIGVDPKQSDQMVRGTCPLPHGSGKEVRVLVFAQGEAATAAKNAGAEFVGYEDILKQVQDGFQDFDVAIATPEAMTEVRKLGRFLGPRGLMPNPKTGTVTDDTAAAIKAVKAGRIDFKLDRNGNISAPIGKVSFTPEQLVDNGTAVLEAVVRAKPASAKGGFLRSASISATVSPGLPLDPGAFDKN
jgi:large subunit ribosomal protein L1